MAYLESYLAAVRELESLGVMPDRVPSLEPMKAGLAKLALDIDPERVIIVAGTNGKGSTSATLEALLLHCGKSVGLYTSPHLVTTAERIRIDGENVSEAEFVELYCALKPVIAELRLSHFEAVTLMAAKAFFGSRRMDHVILEVGLGGTWDATNSIPHSFALITALGYDHQNLLGSTLVEIARNKFGVVGPGCRVIHQPFPPEVVELAREVRRVTGGTWTEREPLEVSVAKGREGEPEFSMRTRWGEGVIALPGRRGAENMALALGAFEALGYDPVSALRDRVLGRVRWPGRMEKFSFPGACVPIYLSGDHNPQGIQSLMEILPYYERKHLHLVVGVGRAKDLDGILLPLSRIKDSSLYLTETPFQGRTLDEYGDWKGKSRFASPSPEVALAAAVERAKPGDLILVTGSLYLVGAVKALAR